MIWPLKYFAKNVSLLDSYQTKMAILDVDKKQKRDQKKKQDEKIVSRNETYLVATVLNSELDESLFALIIVEETGPKDSTLDFIHFTLLCKNIGFSRVTTITLRYRKVWLVEVITYLLVHQVNFIVVYNILEYYSKFTCHTSK